MKNKPNIILIVTEQHRGDCLKIDGHPVLETPTMDQIAHEGVRFSKAYTSCPTCIAARRSILSGQFPSTHGMVGYCDGVEWDAPPTLPGVLRDNGYHTVMIGRDMHQHPARKRYGYDHMITHSDYWEWLERNQPKEAQGWYQSGISNNDFTVHPWPFEEHLHITNWTVNQAIEFSQKRDPSCPFFMTLSFFAAHPPLMPPPFYFERYLRTGVPDPYIGDWATAPENEGIGLDPGGFHIDLKGERLVSARAAYYALINHVDDQLRRLLATPKGFDRETLNNTIIVFTSDHGEMLGDHYRWHKLMPYEGSARIPFLIKAPAEFGINRQLFEDPVCLEDIMPTLLEMADIEQPDTIEGKSLLPLMQKKESKLNRDYIHIEHAPFHHTLTDAKEKYIWFVNDGREQFFDLTKDPHELKDLINDSSTQPKIDSWRKLLIEELRDRPEGFSDGSKLITGCKYSPVLKR